MYNQIIQYIMECAMKHVAVKSVKYQSRVLINQQNSNPNYQVVIEDDAYLQYNKMGNVNTMSLNIDILSHCGDDDDGILDIQSTALQIGAELIKYVETDDFFLSLLKIDDYDFLMLSHFTDDDSAGVRISLQFVVPNPVDMCSFRDNFDEDKGFTVEKEDSIDLKKEHDCENGGGNIITLNPIKLPHT